MSATRATHCQVCGNELTLHESFSGRICGHWRCRWGGLLQDIEDHRAEAGAALGVEDDGSFPSAVVPNTERPLVPRETERLTPFFDYLRGLYAAAKEAAAEGIEPPPEKGLRRVKGAWLSDRVCGTCRGTCCYLGGPNHAFFNRDDFLRILGEHPEWDEETMVEAYLARMPAMHQQSSCLYHGPKGCTLPRRMRSDMCNNYVCKGLKAVEESYREDGTERAFVVVREDGKIRRSAFVGRSGIQGYEPKGPARPPAKNPAEEG